GVLFRSPRPARCRPRARRGCPEPRRPSRGGPVAVRGRSPASARYGRWCLHRPGGYSSSHFLLLRANTANEDRRRPLWTAMAASAAGSLRGNDSSTPTPSREAMVDGAPEERKGGGGAEAESGR